MRFLPAALFTASMMVAAPAGAQETPAAPAPVPAALAPPPAVPPPAAAPAPSGYAPYPYAVPPPGAPPYGWRSPPGIPVTERRSDGMRIAGITLFAAGGVATGIGAAFMTIAITSGYCTAGGALPPQAPRRHARERVGTSRQADLFGCGGDGFFVGAGVAAAGFIGSIVGIPLFVIGNARVRARPQEAASLAPALRVGVGGADLRWTF